MGSLRAHTSGISCIGLTTRHAKLTAVLDLQYKPGVVVLVAKRYGNILICLYMQCIQR